MRYSKTWAILVLLMVVVTVAGLNSGCGTNNPAPKQLPAAPHEAVPGKLIKAALPHSRMILGYYENPWPGTPDTTGSFPSMKTFAKSMTGVGPFWYRATKEGTLEAKDSQLVYDTAKKLGLAMYPLITNHTGATDSILGDATVRSKVINNIIKIVQEKNYDGVDIDFELLPPKHKDNLVAFMTELYPKMQALKKTLIISVFPQVGVAHDVSGAYDYARLAQNADFLQIMTYDKHWSTSTAGPIAPLDWYEKNIQYAIAQAGGPQKIIVGLGVYGYDWLPGKNAETLKYADAIAKAKEHGASILYDEADQEPHFTYGQHEIWFEDEKSVAAKLAVIAKYQPAGIGIWRLGQEQPEVWRAIDAKFPRK